MSDLIARLDSFIEYAEATKKFADAGFYDELKTELTNLKALTKDLTDVLAKLDIEFIGLKEELEAHKEVVEMLVTELKDNNWRGDLIDEINSKLNKDN